MRFANTICSQTSMSESAAYAAATHFSMNASPTGEHWIQKKPLRTCMRCKSVTARVLSITEHHARLQVGVLRCMSACC